MRAASKMSILTVQGVGWSTLGGIRGVDVLDFLKHE